MAKKSAAEMMRKVDLLRQMTGGESFAFNDLPGNVCEMLGYSAKAGLHLFLRNLVTGEGQCGRQLAKVDHNYAWLDSVVGVEESASPAQLHDAVSDETVLPPEPQPSADWQKVVEENQRLQQEVIRLTEDNKILRETAADNQVYIQYVENENTNLVAKIALTQEEKQKKESRQALLVQLRGALPQEFVWPSEKGEIVYQNKFLEELSVLTSEEQKRVIGQLEVFGKNGVSYPSLRSKKMRVAIPHSPPGCMASRGTDELRFTWQKNGGVMVYWLYRKGDSRVRESEC